MQRAAMMDIPAQITGVLQANPGMQRPMDDFFPDWEAQVNRCIAPRQKAPGFERLRHGPRATLGELFMMPGETYTAKEIYACYRARRLVELQMDKS